MSLWGEETGGIGEVAAVGQHEVAAAVGFGVAGRTTDARTGFDEGLEGVGHGIAMDGVVVPELA